VVDALGALKQDHRTIEALFKRFERTGQRAKRTKKKLVAEIVEELARHADIEEQVFYPAVRQATKENTLVFVALEEHGLVEPLLEELPGMEPDEERFEAKVTVLIEVVRHHIKNEERQVLPRIRGALTKGQLEELGQRIVEGKRAIKHPEEYLQSG
jgi:hemerythrin superfamily protein